MSNEEKYLSREELKFIDEFCKKKDIQYVDLRIELVDHLAELTLEKMAQNPGIHFKDAFFLVYKSYGIFGFMEVAEQHEKQMAKRYWREVWQYTKTWITPPHVFLTALLSTCLYVLFAHFETLRKPGLILYILLVVGSAAVTFWQFKQNKKVLNGEKNMLMGGAHQGTFWFHYLILQVVLNARFTSDSHAFSSVFLQPAVLTALLVITLVFSLGNYFLLEKSKSQLHELKSQIKFG